MAERNGRGANIADFGFELLAPSEEDQAAGLFTLSGPQGVRIQLTSRQIQIMSMLPAEKSHVPFPELYELGKILHGALQGHTDTLLRQIEENAPLAPNFVDEPYEYEPLPTSTSIRLLHLLPDNEDGMLQLSMDTFDLNEHIPRFSSLSYTWGNPHAKSTMFNLYDEYADEYDDNCVYPVCCNGRLLYLRQNLYDALQQLPDSPGHYIRHPFGNRILNDIQSAAAQGDVDLVKTSLFAGSDVRTKDDEGQTGLSIAAGLGHLAVTQTLLEAGSDPQEADFNGLTPIDHALNEGHHKVVDLLLNFDSNTARNPEPRRKRLGRGALIWIDAICINQNDIEERTAQVRVMHRIYAQAAYSTVWLGREDSFSETAAATVMKLFSAAKSGALERSDIIPYRNVDQAVYEKAGMQYVSPSEWLALAALYLRQNFRRLWILQESVLPRDVVAFLGRYEIPWEELLFVTEKLVLQQRKVSETSSMRFQTYVSFAIEDELHLVSELRLRKKLDDTSDEGRRQWFSTTRRFWRGEGKKSMIPLSGLIMRTTTFLCSNPRDHIYALLAMCEGHPESPQVDPDYSKPTEKLFADIAMLMIRQAEDQPKLRILSQIRDSTTRNNKALPSWVPDFAQVGVSSLWSEEYNPAGNVEAFEASDDQDWNQLKLRGIKFDTVCAVANPRQGPATVSKYDFDPSWFTITLALPNPYPTGESRTEALWRTLCANQTDSVDLKGGSGQVPAPGRYGSQFCDQVCAMLLAAGEKSALRDEQDSTPSAILFQALMGMQLRQAEGSSESFAVSSPTGDPEDKSLSGPRYRDISVRNALTDLDELTNDEHFSTPSRKEIEAYLQNPKYRLWRHVLGIAADTQVADRLPEGENGFFQTFNRLYGGRRLYMTQKGYLGLGPASLDVGDEIWVMVGSKVPFLLRRKDSRRGHEDEPRKEAAAAPAGSQDEVSSEKPTAATTTQTSMSKVSGEEASIYQYMGDTYTHGIMQGEAVAMADGEFTSIVLE